ncbi:MAG: UDP-N-acetylglucosamine--N-acetylmuramyl-(pentapeptide) pyrophosphoryl-undecaprenol N-acetylglucosamine transferase [Parcubacteria group bacterium Gr01-1014_3]|nr:MAG: UDP-N-acetylglucosamine--N-acetylmuramyl-(pentapeptide) pyrophosphoryl-undecaprenol N-acetylglucosamine transferase [Parcubacteria group bacterium Gr01-1014_3]
MAKIRIAMVGGGTGGHIYPIVSVAEKLKTWSQKSGVDMDIRYFGQPESYGQLLDIYGVRVVKIASSKLRRYFSVLNILDFFKFFIGFAQSLVKLYFYMPDVLFSKGGPGSFSVILAARCYFIPIVVHESDAIPGLANKLASRFAKVIDLAFANARPHFQGRKAQVNLVGNPVREDVLTEMPREQAKVAFGFDPQKPLIFVIGGSQGSTRLNEFILDNLEPLLFKFQVLHQVGKDNLNDYQKQYNFVTKNFSPALTQNYKFVGYLEKDQSKALDAADMVISRGGAGAIFEIAAKGKPSILVPLPESAADHQRQNAYEYSEKGAAIVIEESNLLPTVLIGQIEKILQNPEQIARMSAAAKSFYQPESANQIAMHILEQWVE